MFTQNYINFRHNMFFGTLTASSNGVEYRQLTDYTGEVFNMYDRGLPYSDLGYALRNAKFTGHSSNLTVQGAGVRFGSGLTPATRQDIHLESPFNTEGVKIVSKSRFMSDEGDGIYSVGGIYSIFNGLSTSITISEAGIYCDVAYADSTNRKSVLMERTVFDEPIVIGAGQTKQITYKLTFHH